jgi:hypothetical protein
MKYSTKDQALQITLHIFLDDLESALSLYGGEALKLCTSHEDPKANEYIAEYLNANFSVRLDNEDQTMVFLGKEISEDLAGVWCYLEIPEIPEPNSLYLRYDILLEKFDDQKNILSYVGPAGRESYLSFDQLGERLEIDMKK